MIVVVTRLRPRGLVGLGRVLRRSRPVVDQLGGLPGFRGGRLLVDRRRELWTLTLWQDRAALAAFRELHAPVAAGIDEVATASTTTAWQSDARDVPRWSSVRARWTDGPGPALGLTRTLPPARAAVPA